MKSLAENFRNQEEMLNHDALVQSGDYASRLAQMRSARRVGGPGTAGGSGRPGDQEERGGSRMMTLRKQLDETKMRQEEELRSRQEPEMIVTGLQRELEERDQMLSSLNISSVTSSVLGSPFVMSPQQGSPGDSPGDSTPPTGEASVTVD